MNKYPCKLSQDGCRHGGNKYYNYGFVQGMAEYCYKVNKWVTDLKECPIVEQEKGEGKK